MEFERLYRNHAPEVYRFAYWLSGNAAMAEDITSETFVRAWTTSRSIRVATVRAYLFAIARNYFLRLRQHEDQAVELPDGLPDRRPDPAKAFEISAETEAVRSALRRLKAEDRAAVLMRALEGMPYDEIARALGISLSSAKVKVHRARLKLAVWLGRDRKGDRPNERDA